MRLKFSNINLCWAWLLIEELHRSGVEHICIAPGSRSAPLAVAASEHPHIHLHSHFDERGLGFLALGLARQSRACVGIICTSGSAVANLLPAVVESSAANIPLLILSADRPPELLGCGANQAIEQGEIFNPYLRWQETLPCPSVELDPAYLLSSVDIALARARTPQPGPVHLNCMLRAPLYPSAETHDFSAYLQGLEDYLQGSKPYTTYPSQTFAALSFSELGLTPEPCLLVVGELADGQEVEALYAAARALAWPIIADIRSQLRGREGVIDHLDLGLAQPTTRALLDGFGQVLQVGGRLVSKAIQNYLIEGSWLNYVFVDGGFDRHDPGHRVSRRITTGLPQLVAALQERADTGGQSAGEDAGQSADYAELCAEDKKIAITLSQLYADSVALSECALAWHLLSGLTPQSRLFAGNSLSIRLLDMLAGASLANIATFANRGCSGIDGLLATATGVTIAGQGPLVLLLGDLSLLHDLNSLALLSQIEQSLVIVVINNDGGGIFKLLPLPADERVQAECFTTPHGFEFSKAAAMFGLDYHCPEDIPAFKRRFTQAQSSQRATLLEIKVGPGESALELTRLRETVASL